MSVTSIESLVSLLNEATTKVAVLQSELSATEPVPKLQSEWLLGSYPLVNERKDVARKVLAAIDPHFVPLMDRDKMMTFWHKDYDGHTLEIGFDYLWFRASPSHGLFGLFPGFLRGLFEVPEKRSLPLLMAYLEMFPAYLQWARKYAAFQNRIAALEQDLLCAKTLNVALPDKLENGKRPREIDESEENKERAAKLARTDEDEC